MKRKLYLLSALVVSVFIASATMTRVHAIDSYGVGAVPAYPNKDNPRAQSIFIYELAPGKSVSDGIRVVNNSNERKTIDVYPVDSESSSDGAFACKQQVEPKKDEGSWIQLAKNELILDPHSEEIIPMTVAVPDGTDVGEHNGCIAIQDVRKNEATGNGIVLNFRSALRVAVMVPGKINANLSVKEFKVTEEKGKIIASPLLHNTGNVSVDSQLDLSLKNAFGLELEKGGGRFPILRDTTSRFNIEFKKPFWGGWYTVGGSVAYRQLQTTKQATKLSAAQVFAAQTIFIQPDPTALAIEVIIGVLILAIIAFIIWRVVHNRLLHLRAYQYEVMEGDDIESLAEKNNTTWKIIAKLNHLKPPYQLLPGTLIKIPGTRRSSRKKSTKSAKE